MQQRIAAIMAGGIQPESPHQAAIAQPDSQPQPTNFLGSMQQAAQSPPAPVQKPPSLMDHVIALRGEVHALRQQIEASSQVTEAVGNAVGALYEMFQPSQQQAYSQQAYEENYTNQEDF